MTELIGSHGFCLVLKVAWQRTVTTEDKASWQRIVEVFRGQYGVHMDPRTAYQRCHELQYDKFGSVQGLLESKRLSEDGTSKVI